MSSAVNVFRQGVSELVLQPRGFASVRHEIELLRYEALQTGAKFSVIAIDRDALDRAGEQALSRLVGGLNGGRAAEIGHVDNHRLGIVLPACSATDASDLAENCAVTCQVRPNEIEVYSTDVPSALRRRVKPISRLYVVPIPLWKRAIDVVGSLLGLVVTTPLFVAAAIAIKVTSRGPVIFSQERVGLGGEAFQIYKLRTMRQDADETKHLLRHKNEQDGLGFKIAEDPRVTGIGKLLRKSSLDELPQLINVLWGQMSFVGPRPLPTSDWHPDESWYCQRHDVCPGLTCTWQVSGRSEIGFEEWMQMDIDYVRSRSLGVDIKLMFQTVPAVLSQKGAT